MGWPKGKPRNADERRRISATMVARIKENPRSYGPLSLEHKRKLSEAMKGYVPTVAHRRKVSVALTGLKRGPLSPEHRKKVSVALLGKKVSEETREKLRRASIGHKIHHPPCRHEYNGQAFRSTWEAEVAKILDAKGVRWVYEPERFNIDCGTYTPDFFLPDWEVYCEVKGWLGPASRKKIALFRAEYPHHPLLVLTEAAIKYMDPNFCGVRIQREARAKARKARSAA